MKEEKKFQLTDSTIYNSKILYRVQALKDFGDVKAGDKGGWVESEENLSHHGNCWIYDDAMVFEYSHVLENAKIVNNAKVLGFSCVAGNAIIGHNAILNGDVYINDAKVSDILINEYTEIVGDFEIKSHRDYYLFNLWYPYDEFVTYIPKYNRFVYQGQNYTKEELSKHEDFGQDSSIILGILNRIIDLCKYYKEVYPDLK